MNNTEYHETDDFKFKDSLMREYKENIEKIKAQKEKIKQSYETCNGIAMMKHSQYMTMEQRRRAHKINLDHAVTLCIQNKEIVSNLLTCAANKIKDRICGITQTLEKWHCRGFISWQLLSESYGFIKIFHALINEKLSKPKDNSISFVESAFSSKCKLVQKSCQGDMLDTKCTDSNEMLIRQVLYNYLDDDLEIPDFRKSYNHKYCIFLAKELHNLQKRMHETIQEMDFINKENDLEIFHEVDIDDEENEEGKDEHEEGDEESDKHVGTKGKKEKASTMKYNTLFDNEDIKLPHLNNTRTIEDEEIKEKMENLQMYNDIRRGFIKHLEKADSSSVRFVQEFFIQYIPHIIYSKQSVNRKALYIYQKFYDYSAWILAYGMLLTLVEQLKDNSECSLKHFTSNNDTNLINARKQCRSQKNSLGFNFPYNIFKTYFKEYILKEDLKDGSELDDEHKEEGEEEDGLKKRKGRRGSMSSPEEMPKQKKQDWKDWD